MPLLYGAKLAKERDCYAGGRAFGTGGEGEDQVQDYKKGRATLESPFPFCAYNRDAARHVATSAPPFYPYCAWLITPVGQASAHEPQSMQRLGSIL